MIDYSNAFVFSTSLLVVEFRNGFLWVSELEKAKFANTQDSAPYSIKFSRTNFTLISFVYTMLSHH